MRSPSLYKFISDRLRAGSTKESGSNAVIGLVSVAVSIMVIIIALAVVAGFKVQIRDKAAGYMGALALVAPGQTPLNEQYPFTDSISFLGGLVRDTPVSGCYRVAYTSGLLKTSDNIYGTYFKGVDSLYDFSFFKEALVEGQLPDYHGRVSSEILISRRMADKMGYAPGDRMEAYFVGDEVKVRRFTVCGIFDAQLEEIDETMVVTDIRQVQRINGWESDEISAVELTLRRGASLDGAFRKAEEYVFEHSQDDDPSVFVSSVRRLFPNLFDWLNLLDFNVAIVLALMIVVAGFNMISALLIILFENIQSIGLLKAIGMTTSGVSKVFLALAMNIVVKGLAIGNAVALVICLVQKHFKLMTLDPANYFVKYVPIELNPLSIIIADVASLGVIMAILALTSIFISKISPDRTMRVE